MDGAIQKDFEKSESFNSQIEVLGKFFPYFIHHPDDSPIPIFPTIAQDIGNLLKIIKIVKRTIVSEQ